MNYFRKENICFYALNVFFFASSSLYFGFIVMYLTANGYNSFQCGVINTLISLTSLLFQPIAGYITDTFISTKKYIMLASCATMATTWLLPLTVQNHLLATISIMILSAFATPISFLADSWLVALRETKPYLDYGKNRSGGSVGYAVTASIAGNLIGTFSYNILFILHIIIFGILILIVATIPSVPCANSKTVSTDKQSLSFPEIIKVLAKNPKYCVFLLSTFCFFMASRANCFYIPYKIMQFGGGDAEVGYAIATAAIFEIPVFFIMNLCIRRFKLSYLYLLSTCLLLVRSILLLVASTTFVLLLSQAIEAFTYAFFISVSLEMVSRIVPGNIRATAITIQVAATNGLAGMAGTLLGGILVDRFSIDIMVAVMCVLSVVGILTFAVPTMLWRRKDPGLIV